MKRLSSNAFRHIFRHLYGIEDVVSGFERAELYHGAGFFSINYCQKVSVADVLYHIMSFNTLYFFSVTFPTVQAVHFSTESHKRLRCDRSRF